MSIPKSRFSVVTAAYVILHDGDKILFLKRANTGYMDGYYSLPSGHLDGGEPVIKAAVREAKEEVTIDVKPEDLRLVHTLHRIAEEGGYERFSLFFDAKRYHGKPKNNEPHKCSELRWIDPSNLPENIAPEVRQALKKIANNEPYSDMNFD